jgi:hypothetical protein
MTTEDEPDSFYEIKTVTTKAIEVRIERILHEFGPRLEPWEWGKIFEIFCPELYRGKKVKPPMPSVSDNKRSLFHREKKTYFLTFEQHITDK